MPRHRARDDGAGEATPLAAPPPEEHGSVHAGRAADREPEPRPLLTVVPAAKNVLPFRSARRAREAPALTPVERSAFHEIAEALSKGEAPPIAPEPSAPQRPSRAAIPREPQPAASPAPTAERIRDAATPTDAAPKTRRPQLAILERLPVGVLIHRDEQLSTPTARSSNGPAMRDLAAVAAAGGLERLVVDPDAGALDRINGTGKTFTIATRTGDTLTCEGRLYSVPWNGESALMLVLVRTAAADRLRDSDIALRAAEAETRELRSILDTATDGVIVVDRDGLSSRSTARPRRCSATSITRWRAGRSPSCLRRKASAPRATISTG